MQTFHKPQEPHSQSLAVAITLSARHQAVVTALTVVAVHHIHRIAVLVTAAY